MYMCIAGQTEMSWGWAGGSWLKRRRDPSKLETISLSFLPEGLIYISFAALKSQLESQAHSLTVKDLCDGAPAS